MRPSICKGNLESYARILNGEMRHLREKVRFLEDTKCNYGDEHFLNQFAHILKCVERANLGLASRRQDREETSVENRGVAWLREAVQAELNFHSLHLTTHCIQTLFDIRHNGNGTGVCEPVEKFQIRTSEPGHSGTPRVSEGYTADEAFTVWQMEVLTHFCRQRDETARAKSNGTNGHNNRLTEVAS